MKAFVGVTDLGWYRHLLASGPSHPEVNFWFPSPGQAFRALTPGEPFIFKTHRRRELGALSDRVVGVGYFSGFARLQISEAWDLFGEANGVASLDEFRARIQKYLRRPLARHDDPEVGCVLLKDVEYFAPERSLPSPPDFAPTIVRGRGYPVADLEEGHSVIEAILMHSAASLGWDPQILGPARGEPTVSVPRLGQQAFKAVIAENFGHRCAVTGDRVRPVLQAAHIIPVAAGGEHRADNGLLLRSDVHTLFDRGYLAVDQRYRLQVSNALREQYGNGDWFYQRAGEPIATPRSRSERPNTEFLEWHLDKVFIA